MTSEGTLLLLFLVYITHNNGYDTSIIRDRYILITINLVNCEPLLGLGAAT